ncbi:sigma-54-dependent transcriptional regulator [Lacticaseibacillus hegangensis]|uniref:PrpR N-terminal domain-containing protein n=1 Tax=Lacticaseibacillus hegangensis TaxID=2486010 RepID=A0ABW4CXB3_9LACO|nr:sigma-54-dependent transcriptional regulator [Lacticaseibacillus hegangensis]
MLKVLAIAPYPGLKVQIDKAALQYPEMKVDCYVGDLAAGVEAAKKHEHGFDLILSRGGTAKTIRKAVSIPVVDVEISFLDILRIIKLVDVYQQKYAFVGFENITKQIRTLSEVLAKPIDIITIQNKEQLPEILQRLKKGGYSLIIGDNITAESARRMQFNSILIESGQESVVDALMRTEELGNQLASERNRSRELILAHNALNVSSYVFDSDLHMLAGQVTPQQPYVAASIRQYIARSSFDDEEVVDHLRIHDRYFHLDISHQNGHFYVFAKDVTKRIERPSYLEMLTDDSSPTNSADLIGESKNQIETASRVHSSILVSGEAGTGKESALLLLAANNSHPQKWLVNLKKMNLPRDLHHLLKDTDSIFLDTNAAFFVEGADVLDGTQLDELCSFISGLPQRGVQWIISVNPQSDQGHRNFEILMSKIEPYSMALKPLRLRESDLSSIIGLYVYEFNHETKTTVLGFEPAAMEILQTFSWPGNLKQLKRIVKKLVLESNTAFVQATTVKSALKEEMYLAGTEENSPTMSQWHGQTLEEIERAVVQAALSRNNGNKTLTATQLGISRTTLWRIIKQTTE